MPTLEEIEQQIRQQSENVYIGTWKERFFSLEGRLKEKRQRARKKPMPKAVASYLKKIEEASLKADKTAAKSEMWWIHSYADSLLMDSLTKIRKSDPWKIAWLLEESNKIFKALQKSSEGADKITAKLNKKYVAGFFSEKEHRHIKRTIKAITDKGQLKIAALPLYGELESKYKEIASGSIDKDVATLRKHIKKEMSALKKKDLDTAITQTAKLAELTQFLRVVDEDFLAKEPEIPKELEPNYYTITEVHYFDPNIVPVDMIMECMERRYRVLRLQTPLATEVKRISGWEIYETANALRFSVFHKPKPGIQLEALTAFDCPSYVYRPYGDIIGGLEKKGKFQIKKANEIIKEAGEIAADLGMKHENIIIDIAHLLEKDPQATAVSANRELVTYLSREKAAVGKNIIGKTIGDYRLELGIDPLANKEIDGRPEYLDSFKYVKWQIDRKLGRTLFGVKPRV